MNAAKLYRSQWKLIHAPVWLMALAVFIWLGQHWMPMPPEQLIISSGSSGGMYKEHAVRYAQALAKHGIEAQVLESAGTGENIKRLLAGQAQVGFAQGGYVVSESSNGQQAKLETIAQVDVEPVWVFSRFKDVDSLLRLEGTRVAIGQKGSGSRAVAIKMLEQMRLEPKDLMLSETLGMESVKALREGRIDAMIFVAAAAAPVVQALLQTPGIYLATLRRSAALTERLPYLEPRFVAAGSLSAATSQPAIDTVLLSTVASILVREDAHPMVKRILADTATQLHGGAGPLHRAGEFPHLKNVEFPTSTQSRQALRNGLPWIEQVLGVHWAQWLYRCILVGMPLVCLAWMLSYLIPGYLRWLMESRINRWYGELKFIENDLQTSTPGGLEMARFRGQLHTIDAQVNGFEAPRSYMQRVYVLKKHVSFVAGRLQNAQGR